MTYALFAQGNQAFGDGEAGQAGDVADVQLAHDAFAMGFHGADANVQLARDFLVAETFGDAVPTFEQASDLERLIRTYLADEGARTALAARLPALVAGHTFAARAEQIMRDIEGIRGGTRTWQNVSMADTDEFTAPQVSLMPRSPLAV